MEDVPNPTYAHIQQELTEPASSRRGLDRVSSAFTCQETIRYSREANLLMHFSSPDGHSVMKNMLSMNPSSGTSFWTLQLNKFVRTNGMWCVWQHKIYLSFWFLRCPKPSNLQSSCRTQIVLDDSFKQAPKQTSWEIKGPVSGLCCCAR